MELHRLRIITAWVAYVAFLITTMSTRRLRDWSLLLLGSLEPLETAFMLFSGTPFLARYVMTAFARASASWSLLFHLEVVFNGVASVWPSMCSVRPAYCFLIVAAM